MTITIRTRLYCLTSLTLVLMLVLAGTSYRGMSDADAGLAAVLGSSGVLRNHLEADMMHDALRADVLAALLADGEQDWGDVDASADEHVTQIRSLIRANQNEATNADIRAALDAVAPVLEQYIASGEGVIAAARRDRTEAEALLPSFLNSFEALEARMAEVSDLIEAGATADREHAESVNAFARLLGLIVVGIALFASLGVAAWNIHSITSRIGKAAAVADSIATGSLGHRIDTGMQDEIGRLLDSLRRMDETLVRIVAGVRNDSHSVADAAREIVNGSSDLNQRTQQQAAALEETAASMEEMTATVRQNADNAREANELAANACESAERGTAVVASAVAAMQEISSSSGRIANIIGVIDEIAFQTNLLALNAAVEAARAGEQGRGFAVVASEVRNLAQRSATAAREIKALIGDSVEKVRIGSTHVDASGQTLREIVAHVQRVTQFVSAIAAASSEQAAGIDQVNRAITQMDSTTQQNAALVEESSAASKAMEDQAASLLQQVSFFRIGGNRTPSAPGDSFAPEPEFLPARAA